MSSPPHGGGHDNGTVPAPMNVPTRAPAPSARDQCPHCGGTTWRPSRLAEPEIRRCTRCHLCYRYLAPSAVGNAQCSREQLELIDAARRPLFDVLLARLGPPRGGVLVDVGAGSGYFVERSRAAGWRAIGIEYGRPLAAIGLDLERRVVVGDAGHIPVRSGAATAVTMWDVLDQLDAPRAALAECARVLRSGGTLWVRVRHGTVHQFMRSQRWIPDRLSVLPSNLYSPRSLRAALSAAGFDRIRVMPSPTSAGDPYASMKRRGWMRLVKRLWSGIARMVASLTAGTVIVSPSITVIARRCVASERQGHTARSGA